MAGWMSVQGGVRLASAELGSVPRDFGYPLSTDIVNTGYTFSRSTGETTRFDKGENAR